MTEPERIHVLGVAISRIDMPKALRQIDEWIAAGARRYVCVTPAHGVMDCRRDPSLLEIFNGSGMTTPDGMGVVWVCRLKGFPDVRRVYGPDLMTEVCAASPDRGYRHFLYGGNEGVATKLASALEARFPGLAIVGTHSPPFRDLTREEDEEVVRRINDARPDIIWVGLSTPKQERWMAAHLGRIEAPVMVGVGAAFDFLSGEKPQAPSWIQRSGLEWAFRLSTEPRRLWRRYAEYPLYTGLALAEVVRERVVGGAKSVG